MSSEPESNNANKKLANKRRYAPVEDVRGAASAKEIEPEMEPEMGPEIGPEVEPEVTLESGSIPAYLLEDALLEDDPLEGDLFADEATSTNARNFYAPRPPLDRGFNASAHRPVSLPVGQSPSAYPGISSSLANQPESKKSKWSWLLGTNRPSRPHAPENEAVPGVSPQTDLAEANAPVIAIAPSFWEKQPYRAIAHISALLGTLTAAWLLGILAARIVPGSISRPPLQESVLRKSSRLVSGLWHLPQLWQTPTAETRIEAIPLPETGLILEPVELSPIDRQPLIDELNAVETELLTLDRRIQTIEKRLGKPPYQAADIESRILGLRGAIDPPVRTEAAPNQYEPSARDLQTALLAVAEYKIVLPSDALFSPGDRKLRDSELVNQILDQLINYPSATVVIRSYSDDAETAIAARKYTLNQAIALSEYLARSLPDNYRWITVGGGQSQPIEPNDSAPNRQRNRRIEILIDTR